MKNEIDAILHVEMVFTKKIDMTEFQEQSFKVSEMKEARKNYIISKLPPEGLIKKLLFKAQKDIEMLGFEAIKNKTYAKELTPENAFLECLKNKLEEDLLNGKKL